MSAQHRCQGRLETPRDESTRTASSRPSTQQSRHERFCSQLRQIPAQRAQQLPQGRPGSRGEPLAGVPLPPPPAPSGGPPPCCSAASPGPLPRDSSTPEGWVAACRRAGPMLPPPAVAGAARGPGGVLCRPTTGACFAAVFIAPLHGMLAPWPSAELPRLAAAPGHVGAGHPPCPASRRCIEKLGAAEQHPRGRQLRSPEARCTIGPVCNPEQGHRQAAGAVSVWRCCRAGSGAGGWAF